ncbi:chorismate mutase [Roseicella frigidaeris]|uniref:chorismate mutase n=1 Tax=Roseicella frigidaeris TaxID=2230885 RepID=A0A327MEF5_9PROT|nr:chorismate mutase [Roseicella frigidaeris]
MTAAADSVPLPPEAALAALRDEIDRLDQQILGLLRRRYEVVATLAGSRIKSGSGPLRPGREAMILRRLLAESAGGVPPGAVVRIWHEIISASSALQGGYTVALPARDEAGLLLARDHFGGAIALRPLPSPAAALSALSSGEAQVAILPLPEEGEPPERAWWTALAAPRLQVAARLPFWRPAGYAGPEALAVMPGAPDPSGADRSLLRLETAAAAGRASLLAALEAAGLPALGLQIQREAGHALALAEIEGVVAAGDPRLARLPFAHVVPLGFYAVPASGDPG